MENLKNAISIRAFLGAKDYEKSRNFYQELGFTESKIDNKMSFWRVNENLGFYLQNYYHKAWCDNLMILLEIENVAKVRSELKELNLEEKYENVKISEIRPSEHGEQIFVHDPSGILWHFFDFKK